MTWVRMLLLAFASCCLPAQALEERRVEISGAAFKVVTLDLAEDRLELAWKRPDGRAYGTVAALEDDLRARGRELLFATNAGIYDRAHRPLGLHVEGGRTLVPLNTTPGRPGAGNFSIQPNGVFYVDENGNAGVVRTARWKQAGIRARLATQSGPMLLVDGAINPALDPDSQSRKWRSGVCAPEPGKAMFAASAVPVTFHAFARLFQHLGCRDALYLDGTLSRIHTGSGVTGAPVLAGKPWVGILLVAPAQE